MKLVELKCPNCGAAFQVDGDREFCYCQYCGAKALIDSNTTRIIDEARIKEAEAQAQITQMQTNLELQKHTLESKKEMLVMILIAIICIFCFAMSMIVKW